MVAWGGEYGHEGQFWGAHNTLIFSPQWWVPQNDFILFVKLCIHIWVPFLYIQCISDSDVSRKVVQTVRLNAPATVWGRQKKNKQSRMRGLV